MIQNSRETILDALKRSLGAQTQKPGKDSNGTNVSWVSEGQPRERLKEKLGSLSANICFSKDKGEVESFISDLLETQDIKAAICWKDLTVMLPQIKGILDKYNVELRDSFESRQDFLKFCSTADLGITAAQAIIEESGSIVLLAKNGWERATSLLPPVHLAILDPKAKLPAIMNVSSFLKQLIKDKGVLPSAIHIITGPSRTADIEFNLVLGAHGPRALYILIME